MPTAAITNAAPSNDPPLRPPTSHPAHPPRGCGAATGGKGGGSAQPCFVQTPPSAQSALALHDGTAGAPASASGGGASLAFCAASLSAPSRPICFGVHALAANSFGSGG